MLKLIVLKVKRAAVDGDRILAGILNRSSSILFVHESGHGHCTIGVITTSILNLSMCNCRGRIIKLWT